MPGSTPSTSQLDWLISTTAMIVLFWSRATRDLLKSFGWAIRALHKFIGTDDGAISSSPAPYHLSQQVEYARRGFAARRAAAAVASLNRCRGNVEKGEAPTLLWKFLEIRFHENLDGLFAGMDLDAKGRVAEVNLMPRPLAPRMMA
jgi:hypothetical protein